MRIIKIEALENGGHLNQTGTFSIVPDGWAVIPEDIACENFPFGEVKVADVCGVMTVTKWVPVEAPATVADEITPKEKREDAYNNRRVVIWQDETLTVTEAATKWQYYAAEGSPKADELTVLIAAAKQAIRNEYPEVETEGVTE